MHSLAYRADNVLHSKKEPVKVRPRLGLAMPTSDIAARVNMLGPILLHGLAPDEIQAVLSVATLRRVRANSVLLREGESADEMFLLLEGRARFFTMTQEGKKMVIKWIYPGNIYGGRALLVKRPMSYLLSTEAMSDGSALMWDHDTMMSLIKQCPKLMENALLGASNYLCLYRDLHVTASYGKASRRVGRVLKKVAREMGRVTSDGIEVKVTNEDLANEANVTIYTVSRLLNEWQRKGLLVKGRGKIVIHSEAGLE